MWNFTCEISHVKFHMWNFTCEISHVELHMSFTREILHVKFYMWSFTCDSHVKFHMWNFTCENTCEISHVKVKCEISHVTFTCENTCVRVTCEISHEEFRIWESHVKLHIWHFTCGIMWLLMRNFTYVISHVKFYNYVYFHTTFHMRLHEWNFTWEKSYVKSVTRDCSHITLHSWISRVSVHLTVGIYLNFLNRTKMFICYLAVYYGPHWWANSLVVGGKTLRFWISWIFFQASTIQYLRYTHLPSQ